MHSEKDNKTSQWTEVRWLLIRWSVVLGLLGIFCFWAAWRMADAAERVSQLSTGAAPTGSAEAVIEYWTCTMHPGVQQSSEGDCPKCGMDLVPKYAGSDVPGVKPAGGSAESQATAAPAKKREWYRCTMPECGDVGSSDPKSRCPVCGMKRERVDTGDGDEEAGEFEIKLSERARRLAEVATTTVTERQLYRRIRTVGRVTYDETRYKMVSAWIGGRIDKLFADFTGMTVNRGDHLVELYSPELLSAQEEYLQAWRTARGSASEPAAVTRRSAERVLEAARGKLLLLGVTEKQIAAIEASGEPMTHLVVHAPIGGTIVDKQAMEGMYVDTGDVMYTIADLTNMWVLVELYEADLPWVKPFHEVEITTRSLPGEVFAGQIVFIEPKVDPSTRTVAVRIHVDNPRLQLKPDMWVTAVIESAMTRGGRGAVPRPGGSHACPMHPWETSDGMDICPICEMDMVPVETLPQYTPPVDPKPLLAVPKGAVMQTGERAIVYIETDPGTYLGKEVAVGPPARNEAGKEYYPILSGLEGGEKVVTRGNFAIDSQMQLAGKPSLFGARGLNAEEVADERLQKTTASRPPLTSQPGAPPTDQKVCPVMGNPIDAEVYTDYKGVRVYFCCPPCIDDFVENPAKYMSGLPESVREAIASGSAGEGSADG